jgi:hypothetical protein
MRKIFLSLVLALATLTGVLGSTGSAEAATDHRKCVTSGEYSAVTKNMRQSRVFDILDGRGTRLTQQWDYIDDGYWVEDGEWVDYGYYDDWTGEWVEDWYWEDYSYWQDDYREITDSVRSWKRCSGGYMTINFDNYSGDRAYMHVFKKWGTGTSRWAVANWIDSLYSYSYGGYAARTAEPQQQVEGMEGETKQRQPERPAKPTSEPTTPAPTS